MHMHTNQCLDGANEELNTIPTQRNKIHEEPESRKKMGHNLRECIMLNLAFYTKYIVSWMNLGAIKVF